MSTEFLFRNLTYLNNPVSYGRIVITLCQYPEHLSEPDGLP